MKKSNNEEPLNNLIELFKTETVELKITDICEYMNIKPRRLFVILFKLRQEDKIKNYSSDPKNNKLKIIIYEKTQKETEHIIEQEKIDIENKKYPHKF